MIGKDREYLKAFLVASALVIFAVACHIVARRIENVGLSRFLNLIRTSVYIGLFSVWGVSGIRTTFR